MSTALTSIKEQLKKELQTIGKSVPAMTGNSISVSGKIFKLPNGHTSPGPFEAVVLDWRNFYRYYPPGAEYNAQNPKPPTCFALNRELGLMVPHDDADDPQNENCATCKHNQWGTDPRGGKGKACENRVKLAVVPADATDDADVYVLGISPTAVKHWATYVHGLEAVNKHPIELVTVLSFDPNQSYPTVRFTSKAAHDRLEVFWALRDKAQAILDQPPAT
jgi:hypothetical protein